MKLKWTEGKDGPVARGAEVFPNGNRREYVVIPETPGKYCASVITGGRYAHVPTAEAAMKIAQQWEDDPAVDLSDQIRQLWEDARAAADAVLG